MKEYISLTIYMEDFRSLTDYLAPACILTPESAVDVSLAILILASLEVPFAVRGGGYMPIQEDSNTVGGVLIGLTKLN
jgi:FAD/FMN-containing dehydrogenase